MTARDPARVALCAEIQQTLMEITREALAAPGDSIIERQVLGAMFVSQALGIWLTTMTLAEALSYLQATVDAFDTSGPMQS